MSNSRRKIAYLAPEIPALSATFVYNEILALEKRGFEVVPISVHFPKSPAIGKNPARLSARTYYLYQQSDWALIRKNLTSLYRKPIKYIGTLISAIRDSLKIGMASHVGRGLLYRFLVASQVADILKKEGCRHLHTHFAHVPTDIAMYASGISDVPFSFTSHANDLFERGWLLREKVERARVAITISEYNRRFLIREGADKNKIKIVRCGVKSQEYLPVADKRFKNPSPVIGSLGRLVEKKGMDTLILALGRLNREDLDFHLEIVGDGPLMEDSKKMASEENISSKVVFKGAMPHDEVFEWLKKLDIFVLACRRDKNGDQDGIPVVLMEAMAMGIPVISTCISGIPELIENGTSGLLAQPGDPISLSEKIKVFLQDPFMASAMANAAVKQVREEFDTQVNIERLINLFE
ncbi:MAG: glycosyltransferase [Thermodesulfobacteriota bacterium]|nr:glycosyltransferase [Thermodesulfobacteriota bacterium]